MALAPNPVAADVVAQPSPAPQTQTPQTDAQIPQQQPQAMPVAAQGMGGATPQAPPPPPPTPAQAQIARNLKTGLGFHALMGNHVEYQQTPNGPVPVRVQNTPGQLFRSILAGAIMGMGAGADGPNPGGAGYAAAGRGASAVIQGQRQQQQQAQQQAQQQWENSLKAQEAQRAQQGFDTEQQVRKAQIAQANAETLRTNVMTQGASFDLHQKVVDADKDRISTFTDAGVKPVYENIPESQMTDIIKNSPGASTLDWRHTGVKTTIGPDGNPQYEYTLSAYDPRSSAPLSDATVKQWEDDGLFKYHPEYKEVAKPGKVLSVDQFTALDKTAQNLANQNLAKTKNDLEIEHLKAQIDEAKSAVREHNAQISEAGLNIEEKRAAIARQKEEDGAWDALTAAGNDPTKLTPQQRTILARSVQPLMQETLSSIKTAATEAQAGDKDAADQLPGLWNNLNTYQKLANLAPATEQTKPQVAHPEIASSLMSIPGFNPQTATLVANMDPAKIPDYIASAPLSVQQKGVIYDALKTPIKDRKYGGWKPQDIPKVAAGVAKQAAETALHIP